MKNLIKLFGCLSPWVSLRIDAKTFLDVGIWIAFILAGYGVIVNFSKLGNLYKELEEIEK